MGEWGNGKWKAPEKKRESSLRPNGKRRKRLASKHFDPIPLVNQSVHMHAQTEQNEFPVEHPPISVLPQPPQLRKLQINNNYYLLILVWASVLMGQGGMGPNI